MGVLGRWKARNKGMVQPLARGNSLWEIRTEISRTRQTSGIDDQMKELLSDGNHGIKEEYIGTVIEIGAMEQLKSGAYRHPRFVRLRPDRDAESCVL